MSKNRQTRGYGVHGHRRLFAQRPLSPGPGRRHPLGKPHDWEEALLPSPATAHQGRRGPAPPARRPKPVSAVPSNPDHGLLPAGGELPRAPRAAADSPRPAAPLPPLPAAAAAALTSERTSDRRRPTALTLFREQTNTLEATASPPPSARPATAHARAGPAPRSRGGAPRGSPGRRVFRSLELGPASRAGAGWL